MVQKHLLRKKLITTIAVTENIYEDVNQKINKAKIDGDKNGE